jgi:hypothetical protein
MLPLILPLASAIVPEIGKWLFPSNPRKNEAENAVSGVFAAVTGGDPGTAAGVAAIGATLARTPGMAAELQGKLAELHAAMQAAADKAEQDQLAARLADVANARAATVSLAVARSPLEWAAPVVSLVVTLGFFLVLWLLITGRAGAMDSDVREIVQITVGTLGGAFVTVVSFWVGSSQGSRDKDGTISGFGTALANSTPVKPGGA